MKTITTAKRNMNTTTKITAHPTLSPNRRTIYLTLLTIPRGRWTTYSALASHLDMSPRAVGTAMRTNPFVPDVPCHRVVAVDRSLCGYIAGLEEKRKLLEEEGVGFDHDGRVLGMCWEFDVDKQLS